MGCVCFSYFLCDFCVNLFFLFFYFYFYFLFFLGGGSTSGLMLIGSRPETRHISRPLTHC